jgi:hypothetical protein
LDASVDVGRNVVDRGDSVDDGTGCMQVHKRANSSLTPKLESGARGVHKCIGTAETAAKRHAEITMVFICSRKAQLNGGLGRSSPTCGGFLKRDAYK